MEDDDKPQVVCGRRGCAKQRSGEYLRCSRCKATWYCSRECQKEDYCKGHSACALKGLQAAAEDGPLPAGSCKQVVKILTNNRTNPEVLASAAATITRALQHHTFEDPPTTLLKAGLVPALASIMSPPRPVTALLGPPPVSVQTMDTMAAVFNALLAPCAEHFLQNHHANETLDPYTRSFTPEAYALWLPAFRCLWSIPLATDVVTIAFRDSPSGREPHKPIPGTETMQLAGLTRLLVVIFQGGSEHYATHPGIVSVKKLLAVYEREMQSGSTLFKCSLLLALYDHLEDSEGKAATDLLRLPGAVALLAKGLDAFPPQRGSQQRPALEVSRYLLHVSALEPLCRWTASKAGLQGLQQIAKDLARPMITAVDQIFSLSEQGLPSSALGALQLISLKVMCHMATTPAGRSRMAAAGCLPGWLRRAPELPQKVLLVLLLLPLGCASDWTSRLYWETLHRGGEQVEMRVPTDGVKVEAYRKSCPPLLKQQVASEAVVDTLAGLLKGTKSGNIKAILVDVLLKACAARPALTPAAITALVGAAARPLEVSEDSAGHPDLIEVRALKCVLKHRINHGSYAAPVAKKVDALVLEWLAHLEPSTATAPPTSNGSRPALTLYLRWVSRAECESVFPPTLLQDARLFRRMLPVLGLGASPQLFFAAALCLFNAMMGHVKLDSAAGEGYAKLVADPACTYLHRLLAYIRHQVALLSGLSEAHIAAEPMPENECLGTCRDWASVPPMAAQVLEAVSAPLLMVGAVALRLPAAGEVAAHQQVLKAWWLWDVMRLLVGAGGEGLAMCSDLAMYLAALASGAPGHSEDLLHHALQRAGRGTVEAAVVATMPPIVQLWAKDTMAEAFAKMAALEYEGRAPPPPWDDEAPSGSGPRKGGNRSKSRAKSSSSSSSASASKQAQRAAEASAPTPDPAAGTATMSRAAALSEALFPTHVAASRAAAASQAAAAAPTSKRHGALPKLPKGLPSPSSFTDMPLPPVTMEHYRMVLAAMTEPTHPLFPICIRVLGGKATPLPRKDILAVICHAAHQLPAHFTPRAAAIVATGLAIALRNLDEDEDEEAGGTYSGVTAGSAALGRLLRFGVCCPEAAPEVSSEEDYVELLAKVGSCAAHVEAHPELRARAKPLFETPRYTCLENLCCAAVKGASFDPEVVREAALPQSCLAELVEWLVAAGVECQAGSPWCLLMALLDSRQHKEDVRQLLLKSPALKQGLTTVADSWLDALGRSTNPSEISSWGQIMVATLCCGFPSEALPASPTTPAHTPSPALVLVSRIFPPAVHILRAIAYGNQPPPPAPPPRRGARNAPPDARARAVAIVGAYQARGQFVDLGCAMGAFILRLGEIGMEMVEAADTHGEVVDTGLVMSLLELACVVKTDPQALLYLKPVHALMAHGTAVGLEEAATAQDLAPYVQLKRQIYDKVTSGSWELVKKLQAPEGCHPDLKADLVSIIAYGLPEGAVIDSQLMQRDIVPHKLSMGCILGCRHLARARAEVLAAAARGFKVEGRDGIHYSLDVDLHTDLECVLEDCCPVQALQPCHGDVVKLRNLVGAKVGLSKQDTVVHSKEALWRLGQFIETGLDPGWRALLGDTWAEKLWWAIKGLTGHKMAGQQLQQLYRTMKQKGYRSPRVLPGHPSAPPVDREEAAALVLHQADVVGYTTAIAAPLLRDLEGGSAEAASFAWATPCLHMTSGLVAKAPPALALTASRCLASILFMWEASPSRRMPQQRRADVRGVVRLERVVELALCAKGAVDTTAALCLLAFVLRDGEAEADKAVAMLSRPELLGRLSAWLRWQGLGGRAAVIVCRGLAATLGAWIGGAVIGGMKAVLQARGQHAQVLLAALQAAGVEAPVSKDRSGLLADVWWGGELREVWQGLVVQVTPAMRGRVRLQGGSGVGARGGGGADAAVAGVGAASGAMPGGHVQGGELTGSGEGGAGCAAGAAIGVVERLSGGGGGSIGSSTSCSADNNSYSGGDNGGNMHGTSEPAEATLQGAGGSGAGEEDDVKECVVCSARPPETFRCSGCMAVRYCSRECQKAHWKKHRKWCQELKEERAQIRKAQPRVGAAAAASVLHGA